MFSRNAFKALLISLAVAAAAPVPARADLPALPLAQPDTKGTIGLVCVDNVGRAFTWYQNLRPANAVETLQRDAFENCVSSVVYNWANNPYASMQNGNTRADTDGDFNEMLGGYSSYRNAINTHFRNSNGRR